MLDLQFIRDNPDIVRAAMKHKNREGIDLDRILTLAEERKKLAGEVGEINRKRNEAAKERALAKTSGGAGSSPDASSEEAFREAGKALKEELQKAEEKYKELEKELVGLLVKLPNIPSVDTPVGPDESGNQVLREWGQKPSFSFKPKAHWDLGRELGLIDSEKAADVSGARFTYLKGDLALMQFALADLAIKTLTSREALERIAGGAGLSMPSKPFVPVVPPLMMRSQVMNRMARLDPIDDRFYFEKDDLVLIGSAEHTLGPLHMDETLKEEVLPLRYVAFTPAFRREAGAAGKDTRGILRQHQFDKIEMECFTAPEEGMREQDFLVAIQEYFMRELKLPYRVMAICTGDMGFPDQRQIDIETWMPGQEVYRETHSADYVGGFQARRLNTKVKRASGESEVVHMNDATAFAIGRTLIAIMENCQQEDGSIEVPEVLRVYLGKDRITKASA